MENLNSEIDLIKLVLNIFKLVKRYILFFILAIIIGIAISFVIKYKSKRYYLTKMIITQTSKNSNLEIADSIDIKSIIIEEINSLNEQIANKNFDYISNELKLNISNAKMIDNIEINSEKKNNYVINFKLNNISVLDSLALKLVFYLNNNFYLKNISELNKKYNEELLIVLNSNILKIDSLLNVNSIYDNLKTNNTIVLVNNYEENLFKTKLGLIRERQNIEANIEFYKTVHLVKDMIVYQNLISNFSYKTFILCILITLFVAIGLIIVIELNKLSKQNSK